MTVQSLISEKFSNFSHEEQNFNFAPSMKFRIFTLCTSRSLPVLLLFLDHFLKGLLGPLAHSTESKLQLNSHALNSLEMAVGCQL